MRIDKKFTAIELIAKNVDDTKVPDLQFGSDQYMGTSIDTEHDTEAEAIEYAYNMNQYGKWLILPIVRFKQDWED
jgi:hypothetical protein